MATAAAGIASVPGETRSAKLERALGEIATAARVFDGFCSQTERLLEDGQAQHQRSMADHKVTLRQLQIVLQQLDEQRATLEQRTRA